MNGYDIIKIVPTVVLTVLGSALDRELKQLELPPRIFLRPG